MTTSFDWTALGSIATASAVLVAAWQLYRGTSQARTNFEDDLSSEYRDLARSIPVKVHFGEELAPEEFEQAFPRLYQYIDLTNEQIFLRMNGRISKATWFNWRDGIRSNLARPAFAKAWTRVKAGSTGSFSELRRLEASGFSNDPRRWVPAWKRLSR
jgi:hypothetical protein